MYSRTLRLQVASMEAVMLALAFITFVFAAGWVNDTLYDYGILREHYIADAARFNVEMLGMVPVLIEEWLAHSAVWQSWVQPLTTFVCVAGTVIVTVGPLYFVAL
ncbi:MAG: hypothetical protein AAB480_03475 [Patescibacteria group bacterium]